MRIADGRRRRHLQNLTSRAASEIAFNTNAKRRRRGALRREARNTRTSSARPFQFRLGIIC